jgi:hypothetical protein
MTAKHSFLISALIASALVGAPISHADPDHNAEWYAGYGWAASDPATLRSSVHSHHDATELCTLGAGANANSNQDFYEGCLAGVHDITGK